MQLNLFNEKLRQCPECRKPIRTWLVVEKEYGYCDNCVKGFYFE